MNLLVLYHRITREEFFLKLMKLHKKHTTPPPKTHYVATMTSKNNIVISVVALSISVFITGCTNEVSEDYTDTTSDIESGLDIVDTEVEETGEQTGDPNMALRLTSSSPPANLLVISVDTIRGDFVYGEAGNVELPFIAELMANGLVLKNHQSCSNWTVPSLYCLLTGRNTTEIGYHPTGMEEHELPASEYTIAERLSDAGFATQFLTSNPVTKSSSAISQGSQDFVPMFKSTATEVTDGAIEMMSALGDSGWYSQIHYYDPHSEYNPPEEYLVGVDQLVPTGIDVRNAADINQLRTLEGDLSEAEMDALRAHLHTYYNGELRYLDSELRRLFDSLDATGRLDNTLVMFIGDHGEQHFDHGKTQHGRDLFQEETRVPALFWMKDGGIEVGEWDEATTHADILPTLFEAMGIPYLITDIPLTGVPVGTATSRTLTAIHAKDRGSAVRVERDNHELILRLDGRIELYTVNADHLESENLYTQNHPYLDELLEEAEVLVDRLREITPILRP